MRVLRWMTLAACGVVVTGCGVLNPINAQRVVRVETTQSSGQGVPSLCTVITYGGPVGEATWLTVTQGGGVRLSPPLTETSQGSFAITNDGQLPRTTQASPAQLDALQQAIASAEWQQLDEEYGVATPDQATQHVVCGGKGIDVHPGAEQPAVLIDVMQQLEALQQQAQ